jgi:hypothetical protein
VKELLGRITSQVPFDRGREDTSNVWWSQSISSLSEINIYTDGCTLLNPRIYFFKVTGNADVWKLYSELYKDGESEEEKDKVVNILTCRNPVCTTRD